MACAETSDAAIGVEEQKERGLIDVLFLCDEWKSSKGGLSTFNRELAIDLAKTTTESMKIHCYVSKSDDRDREDARQHAVNLITAQSIPGSADPLDWLKIPPPELPHPDIVIGHGRKFGTPAYFIVKAKKCKWLQFVHVFCEDLGKYKVTESSTADPIEDNEKKHKREIELCEAADLVVAVGKRLHRKYSKSLPDVKIEIITPGILEKFASESKLVLDRSVIEKFNVFMFGRANFEDLILKGYDIVANAIGSLGKTFELTFVGSCPGEQTKVEKWFLDNTCIKRNQLTIRGYCSEQDELKKMFYQSDLVALPSRTDGFGLVALEAISAGTPVLVAGECGIAEALKDVEGGKSAIVESDDDVEKWVKSIKQLSSQSPEERQNNAMLLRKNYKKKYPWKTECERFKRMIHSAMETVNVLDINIDVDTMKPGKCNMQNTAPESAMELAEYQHDLQPEESVGHMTVGHTQYPRSEDLQVSNIITPEKVLCTIALKYLEDVSPKSMEDYNKFLTYMKEMQLIMKGVTTGSLVITVKCVSLQILEELWEHYSSGHLGKVVQNYFVTKEILKELNLAELKLKTTIKEEEFKACKVYLKKETARGSSPEPHLVGYISEGPQKQDQMGKWEQEREIMKSQRITANTDVGRRKKYKASDKKSSRKLSPSLTPARRFRKHECQSKARQTSNRDWPSLPGPAAASRVSTFPTQPNSKTSDVNKSSVNVRSTPKSQWESLVQISPLQIHHTVNLVNATENASLTAQEKSNLHLGTDRETPGQGVAFDAPLKKRSYPTKALPEGVFPLCAHFLQDNRKGQPFQHPRPCAKCLKDSSKLVYGVWRSSKKEWQVMRPYPEEVGLKTHFQPCWYFSNGLECKKNPCTFAHGQEELTFWTWERKSKHVSFRRTTIDDRPQQEDDLKNFPKPQERIQGSLIIRDIRANKPRPPPTGVHQEKFQLCKWWKSGRLCRYGRFCTFAHGNEELRSWIEYKNEDQQTESEEESTCAKTGRGEEISRSEMVYSLPGVTVSCDKPTVVKIILRDEYDANYTFDWVFTVTFEMSEVGKLRQIDLLHRYHECYRLTEVKGFLNDKEIRLTVPKDCWSYTLPSLFDKKKGRMDVAVTVSFNTTAFNGTFTQCLKFEFGKKPYLLQGLNVDIASEDALNGISEIRRVLKLDPSVWTEGSLDIVPWPESTGIKDHDLLLLKQYQLPERIENVISLQIVDGNLNMENYKRVMHQLLFTEELFMKKAISSFVLHDVPLHCKSSVYNERSGVTYAGNGELFGIVKFHKHESLQLDDTAGRLLTRIVQSAWLRLSGSNLKKVYEARLEAVEIYSERVTLKLSSQLCLDLKLTNNGDVTVDIQFQLNRQPLCEWHAAIDKLGPVHLNLLFPEKNSSQVSQEDIYPWNWLRLDPKLNDSQREVIMRILAPEDISSPLVVFGPFGTGKTFTLNQAIRQLVTRERNRILLCTHTNSAADIHVRLLHEYLTEQNGLKATKPLRIYHTKRRLDTDSEIAKNYGLIKNNAYVLPTREDVIRHRVVITTLAVSRNLLELQLNHGFFTHILVDEAAQALEPEALIPLALAGPNTKVVFTGDHMQMSPEVYSHYARDWGLQRSLPERLFDHLYCETEPQSNCNVMFLTENYRCHPEILQFSSYNFYGEGLTASSEQPPHPRLKPLLFYSTHCMEEARENSYINMGEVDEVVKRVKELAIDWPEEWKEKDLSRIGVISAYTSQVRAIRTSLRNESKELTNVTVESVYNVQGKEFRALFISTVRTSLTFPKIRSREEESQQLFWEFLSDPKLLNTAVTRAMSLVAVVGDAVSLCTVGDCRGNWRDYIRRCDQQGSLFGTSYKEIKQAIDAPLSNISLNPEAAVFVPSGNRELQPLVCAGQPEKDEEETLGFEGRSTNGLLSPIQNSLGNSVTKNVSGIEIDRTITDLTSGEVSSEEKGQEEEEEKQEEVGQRKTDQSFAYFSPDDLFSHQDEFMFLPEVQSTAKSVEEEDDGHQSTLDLFEDFRRESFEDETMFSRYFDKIIEALVERCKETKEKEIQRSSKNKEFPSLKDATTLSRKRSKAQYHSDKRSSQEKSSFSGLSSEDYQIYRDAKGRQKARLVNLGFHLTQSDRLKRLTGSVKGDEFLDSEVLLKLISEQPGGYLSTTLHLDSETAHMAYAVVADTKTPDIKIKGRIRRVFDMDHVVVKIAENQPISGDGVPCSRGKIVGVLHHIISPHERQFVCKVDYENPGVMLPINKSVSKIVTLSAEGVKGVPLYKEMREGNEKKVKVDEIPRGEFLSGKNMFLVQFLQWRSDCTYPLGIIIRKLPQRYTSKDSMEVLFAEHGIRKSFDEKCKEQVQTRFPSSWSIPAHERLSRKQINRAFTIDPDNSKDLDDALSLDLLPDSVYRVGVHIADVSYFVEAGTYLDKEALFRCTSYYPGHDYQSIPMLPRELSENHCSLLPGRDRLCLSLFLDVSEDGKLVEQPHIRRTIVRSSCKLTYSDAQKIIDRQESSRQQLPKDIEENIRDLSALAQRRRTSRLREAASDHWSSSDDPENYEAHELVEEMMIFANEEIAKFLSLHVQEMAPLRTQLQPKEHRLNDWVKRYGRFIKYSPFLRGVYSDEDLEKMTKDVEIPKFTEFKVLKPVWTDLCSAAESGDKAKLHQLICNERNHPQLAIAKSQFQRIQQKAQYVCQGDHPKKNIVHFSQRMRCYTHFTSPIRRYIDIQLHRLVLDFISKDHGVGTPSKDEVANVCRRSTFAQANSKKFDKACSKVHLAAKLKEKSHETTAVIAMIEDKRIKLEITNQEYNHFSKRQREIKLSSLNPFNVKQDGSEMVLTWKLRLYIAPKEDIIEKLDSEREKVAILLSEGLAEREVLNLPGESWQKLLKELQEENYENVKMAIRKMETDRLLLANRPRRQYNLPNTERPGPNREHFFEKHLSLRTFDNVNIQLTAHMTNGLLHPDIQLFKINASVHICVEHRKYPRECFATTSRYQASRKEYSNLDIYIAAWKPVLDMEGATAAVHEGDEFTMHDLYVEWRQDSSGNKEGTFNLQNEYCKSRQIKFYAGDFVCVRVRQEMYMKKPNFTTSESNRSEMDSDLENEGQFTTTQLEATSSLKCNTGQESRSVLSSFWVGHCVIRDVRLSPNKDILLVTIDLHHSASDFPRELLNGGKLSTLTVIHRPPLHRRMFAALCSGLKSASKLVHAICMGHEPSQEEFELPPSLDLSVSRKRPKCGLKPLNQYQNAAVQDALVKPLSLIQGPPGTGKTVTGVHIAFWFAQRNKPSYLELDENTVGLDSADKPSQVIYCGPSNKSVDVVAEYMLQIPGLKIIRVYSDVKEQAEFPLPNKRRPLKISSDDEAQIISNEKLKEVSLHHLIRADPCPFANDLREYECKFDKDRKKGLRTSEEEVENYHELIKQAEHWALQSTGVQIILCTCAVAGKSRIKTSCNIQQCIVDECGMCMELETLVPITSSAPRQVVLIGDHKQLQPVIQDNLASTLGLNVSMFERLSERATMLQLQYRMQEEICKFPSDYFYERKLETDPSVPSRDSRLQSFWPVRTVPMAFCHVEGEEESTPIKTAHSNEQSKANMKEVRKVVHVARCLVKNKVPSSSIVILSPYREQRERISIALAGVFGCKEILVTTIRKSQGSEWDYVILSLVRSLSKDDLDAEPSLYWLREHLGFLTDEHLMNVGLTRARKGLCIIG